MVSSSLLLIPPLYLCLIGKYLINTTGYTILKWEKSFNWQDFVVENRKFWEEVFFPWIQYNYVANKVFIWMPSDIHVRLNHIKKQFNTIQSVPRSKQSISFMKSIT